MDEGYINAFAIRMIDGHWLPYVDAVSHRGPMLYWVAAMAVALGKPYSFVPLRNLAALCSLLTVAFVFAAAWSSRRRIAAGSAALAITLPLALEMRVNDGIAYNGEPLLNVFAFAALLCLAHGLRSDRVAPSLLAVTAAGLLTGCAVLTKHVAAVLLVPFSLWVLIAGLHRPNRGRVRPLIAFSFGVLVPVLAVAIRYALAGELRTFAFYFVTYNVRYYMAPFSRGEMVKGWLEWILSRPIYVCGALALSVAGIARAFRSGGENSLERADREAFLWVTALASLLSLLVANVTLRDFYHYYVQVVPWFALLFGLLLEELVVSADASNWRRAALGAVVLAPIALLIWFLYRERHEQHLKSQATATRELPFCEYVNTHSDPEDRIYVWGFAPEIYTRCKRSPASRYVYSTFPSGWVPFFDAATEAQDEARVVPGSREILLRELRESRPRLIIDAAVTLGGRSLTRIKEFREYLDFSYCAPETWDNLQIYRRRSADGSCT